MQTNLKGTELCERIRLKMFLDRGRGSNTFKKKLETCWYVSSFPLLQAKAAAIERLCATKRKLFNQILMCYSAFPVYYEPLTNLKKVVNLK